MGISAGGHIGDKYDYPARKAEYVAKIEADRKRQEEKEIALIPLYALASIFAVGMAVWWHQEIYVPHKELCRSQGSRITASSPSTIFNRCHKTLANGRLVTWNSDVQRQKDEAAELAPSLKHE